MDKALVLRRTDVAPLLALGAYVAQAMLAAAVTVVSVTTATGFVQQRVQPARNAKNVRNETRRRRRFADKCEAALDDRAKRAVEFSKKAKHTLLKLLKARKQKHEAANGPPKPPGRSDGAHVGPAGTGSEHEDPLDDFLNDPYFWEEASFLSSHEIPALIEYIQTGSTDQMEEAADILERLAADGSSERAA